MHKHSSTSRQGEILQIVKAQPVRSQDELMKLLRKRGVRVTQPTLSRDIHEIGLVKGPAGYAFAAAVAAEPSRLEERLDHAIREFAISAATSGTIAVLRTPVAAAQPLARAIDEATIPDAVGTLAGDDTIFVAMRDAGAAGRFVQRVESIIRPSQSRRTRA